MDTTSALSLFSILGAAGSALYLALTFRSSSSSQDFRSLMDSSSSAAVGKTGVERVGGVGKRVVDEEKLKSLKEEKSKKLRIKNRDTQETRFIKAGIFSKADQARIKQLGPILAVFLGLVVFIGCSYLSSIDLALAGGAIAAIVGLRFPSMYIDRKIELRSEEILYYLPLVIEQIAIGVSSSLDIGPCLGVVVKMADERGSHNVVTELLKHVQFYVKSGASLEEALDEVGNSSGHTELGHAFMSLAQVSKHGGEISRQMQELADAVSAMRETKVEERIKTLELKATGPVALVFVGFMIILIAGFFIQIKIGMSQ